MVAAVWLVVNQNVNCSWLHVERIPVFLSLSAAAVLKNISCLWCVQTTRTTHSSVHGHLNPPLHGWLLDLWMIWNSMLQSWFINGLYCIICFVLCDPIHAVFSLICTSRQFMCILMFPDLYCCVWMLTPWLCSCFCIEMPAKCVGCMCVALLLSISMMYHSGFRSRLHSFLTLFSPHHPPPPAHWGCGTERNWTQEKGGEGYPQETAQDNWEGEEEKDKEIQT